MELIKAIKIIWNHQCNDIKGEKCACLRTSFMFENFLSPFSSFFNPRPVDGTLMIFIWKCKYEWEGSGWEILMKLHKRLKGTFLREREKKLKGSLIFLTYKRQWCWCWCWCWCWWWSILLDFFCCVTWRKFQRW